MTLLTWSKLITIDASRKWMRLDMMSLGNWMLMSFLLAHVNATLISYMLQFDSPSFTNPEYELVALHPEHFLPYGNILSVFHSADSTPTNYVSARDQRLRMSSSPNSPLPAFHDITERSSTMERLNIFLVILNAEIKFHWYLHMISQTLQKKPLPADVFNLMKLTVELVHQLYWIPVPTKGSQGETSFSERMEYRRTTSPNRLSKRRAKFGLPENMDLETRKEYGRALMNARGTVSSL